MKTLSIKQPWASLIASGIKDIENRTWQTKYRGRIYIHASGKPSFSSLGMGLTTPQLEAVAKYNMRTFDPVHDGGLMLSSKNTWKYSAIIGEVDITDCVFNHPSIWADPQNDPIKNIWHWVLANPVMYDQPILNVKGRLSLWEYERTYEVIGTAEMVTSTIVDRPIHPFWGA